MNWTNIYVFSKRLVVYFMTSIVLLFLFFLFAALYHYIISPKTTREGMLVKYENVKIGLKDSVHEKKVLNNSNYIKMLETENEDSAEFYFRKLLNSLDSSDFKGR
jgi:hypothetical protein